MRFVRGLGQKAVRLLSKLVDLGGIHSSHFDEDFWRLVFYDIEWLCFLFMFCVGDGRR